MCGNKMKKAICLLLVICMTALFLSGCASEKDAPETSALTANIDKYWQEHDMDAALDEILPSET